LISGREFDPAQESAHFRIAATDNATQLYGPTLSRRFAEWQKTSLSFFPWTDQAPDELDRGRLELILNAEDGFLPPHLKRQILFEDEFVCVVAKDYPLKHRFSLKQYVAANHIGVSVLGGRQTLPETPWQTSEWPALVQSPFPTLPLRSGWSLPVALSLQCPGAWLRASSMKPALN
jgi:DNA-binding transcriptional LysR family regulator